MKPKELLPKEVIRELLNFYTQDMPNLDKLIRLPSRGFAALHFNISEAQLQKRTTRTKIIKLG